MKSFIQVIELKLNNDLQQSRESFGMSGGISLVTQQLILGEIAS